MQSSLACGRYICIDRTVLSVPRSTSAGEAGQPVDFSPDSGSVAVHHWTRRRSEQMPGALFPGSQIAPAYAEAYHCRNKPNPPNCEGYAPGTHAQRQDEQNSTVHYGCKHCHVRRWRIGQVPSVHSLEACCTRSAGPAASGLHMSSRYQAWLWQLARSASNHIQPVHCAATLVLERPVCICMMSDRCNGQ